MRATIYPSCIQFSGKIGLKSSSIDPKNSSSTHRIHVDMVYLPIFGWFLMVNLSRYASPMDGMGFSMSQLQDVNSKLRSARGKSLKGVNYTSMGPNKLHFRKLTYPTWANGKTWTRRCQTVGDMWSFPGGYWLHYSCLQKTIFHWVVQNWPTYSAWSFKNNHQSYDVNLSPLISQNSYGHSPLPYPKSSPLCYSWLKQTKTIKNIDGNLAWLREWKSGGGKKDIPKGLETLSSAGWLGKKWASSAASSGSSGASGSCGSTVSNSCDLAQTPCVSRGNPMVS